MRANLEGAFPELYRNELLKIERSFYKQLFDLLFEGIKLGSLSQEELLKHCSFKNPEILTPYFEQDKNVIIVMGHTGNWEWASASFNLSTKHQLQTLYQPIKNNAVNDFVLDIRQKFGTELMERKKALRQLLSQKNDTEIRATNFLADQSPYELEKATWKTFFNLSTPFFNGYAAIGKKLNYPIFYLHIFKEKRGHYRIELSKLVEEPSKLSVDEIVGLFAKKLEAEIRKQPFNWLWSHKRWKKMHLRPASIPL